MKHESWPSPSDWGDLTFPYAVAVQPVTIGEISLDLWSFADLDRVLDDLIDRAQALGRPEIVEAFPPYFGQIWHSGQALTEYLAQLCRQGLLDPAKNPSLLEIGCGLALPSLWLAKAGFARVHATDSHPDVPVFLRHNKAVNQLAQNPTYEAIAWHEIAARPVAAQAEESPHFDWVIGSDILYERAFVTQVADALHRQVKAQGRVVVADPGRPHLQAFVSAMEQRGFKSQLVAVTVHALKLSRQGPVSDIYVLDFSRG